LEESGKKIEEYEANSAQLKAREAALSGGKVSSQEILKKDMDDLCERIKEKKEAFTEARRNKQSKSNEIALKEKSQKDYCFRRMTGRIGPATAFVNWQLLEYRSALIVGQKQS
jgi:hypothetical protein